MASLAKNRALSNHEEKRTIKSAATVCKICMERKQVGRMFRIKSCSHIFCSDCVSKHVASKIKEKVSLVICPDDKCKEALEPEFCKAILQVEVFERWGEAVCESMVPVSKRFYCPYKECSALLEDLGVQIIRESECPNCHRLFCAQCKVPWHSEIKCEDFQKLKKDERGNDDHRLVVEIANREKWKRCPMCKFYVERISGCTHIVCRFSFPYGCGIAWSATTFLKIC
ncbi:E3 ubiquitin-protein ligase RSL1-like [Tasmannia lanceolata]|uniref:E3 ubiquitin-protein ligase RSL1-like n=1 Tax=Tasmannia lanceolata TaxID=3420 RepID=UPI00406445DF